KRRRPSVPANSSTSLRSRSFTTSPRLSASKSRSIFAWLMGCLKGDAGEDFKDRSCHLKISARGALFARIGGQLLVFDPGSEQRNHPVENPHLKADKAELALKEMSAVINSTFVECRHGTQFRANLLPEEFPQFFAQPVDGETLSRGEEKLHDRFGGDLPHPFSPWSNLAYGKEKTATSATGGFR